MSVGLGLAQSELGVGTDEVENLVVPGSMLRPWSLNPEAAPFCLSAAPRLNCSTKAPNCSLPELERTTEWEKRVRRTHE
jgi:hypothetical protein